MILRPTWRSAMLVGGESVLMFGALVAASYLRLGGDAWTLLSEQNGFLRVILVIIVCQTSLHYADMYDVRFIGDTRDLLIRLFQALGATSLVLEIGRAHV